MKKIIITSLIFSLFGLQSVFANSDNPEQEPLLVGTSRNVAANDNNQNDNDPDTLSDVYRRIPGTPHWNMIPAEGYEAVSIEDLTVNELRGADVYDEAHEIIADVGEVLTTNEDQIERVIIDIGGFLGIGAKSVAFEADALEFYKGPFDDLRVYIPMTEDELKELPRFTE